MVNGWSTPVSLTPSLMIRYPHLPVYQLFIDANRRGKITADKLYLNMGEIDSQEKLAEKINKISWKNGTWGYVP